MTTEQKRFVKTNWISFSTLVVLVGFIVQQSRWQQSVDNRISVLEHYSEDETKHMPFEKRIEIFVPRIELDSRLRSIENSLIEIKQSLKK
ncbi:MAG: hypothetical protein ACPGRW_06105 [Flavobacteriaceae bacterium]